MREQKNIRKLVGRIGDSYYVCDYVFKYDDGLKGATATVLRPVSKQEYEAAQEIDNLINRFADLWGEAARDNRTEESLKDYCQSIYDCDGDEAIWDFSGYDCWDLIREAVSEITEENYPVIECVGGGRSFSSDMQWDEIYDKEIWNLILEYESETDLDKT